jgi:hypothetical protein
MDNYRSNKHIVYAIIWITAFIYATEYLGPILWPRVLNILNNDLGIKTIGG